MSETKSVTKPVYKKGKITGIIIRVINDKEGVVVGNEEECFPLGYTFTISSASHWDTVDFEEEKKIEPFIEKPSFPSPKKESSYPHCRKSTITGSIVQFTARFEGVMVKPGSCSFYKAGDVVSLTKGNLDDTYPHWELVEGYKTEFVITAITENEERVSRMQYLYHIQNWKDEEVSSEPKELIQETLHPSFRHDTVAPTSHLLGANKF